jgi:hypothetical protein
VDALEVQTESPDSITGEHAGPAGDSSRQETAVEMLSRISTPEFSDARRELRRKLGDGDTLSGGETMRSDGDGTPRADRGPEWEAREAVAISTTEEQRLSYISEVGAMKREHQAQVGAPPVATAGRWVWLLALTGGGGAA